MKKFKLRKQELIVLILIVLAVAVRLLPHPANFAPISAVAIFGAYYLKDKRLALALPLLAMLVSDAVIGFYHWPIMLSVYLSFLVSALLGLWLKKRYHSESRCKNRGEESQRSFVAPLLRMTNKLSNGVGVSLFASIQFYIITNFAVWAFGTMYTKDLAGLINCYFMALPFFRNTLLGDMFYIGVLFSTYALVTSVIPNLVRNPHKRKTRQAEN